MNKQNVVYTYSAVSFSLKKKTILSDGTTLMSLEDIILSEINLLLKDKYCIPLT